MIRPQKLQVLANKVQKEARRAKPLIEFTSLHLDAEG